MRKINEALKKFFDVDTIRGTFRILGCLVLGFVFIWYLQEILNFVYDVTGLDSFQRSMEQARYHRAVGGSVLGCGLTMGALNIYGIYRQKENG